MDPDISQIARWVTGAAFGLAVVFGAVAQRYHFCTLGAIADYAGFGDSRRLRMWGLAIAVAIAGTGALTLAGVLDPAKTIYGSPRVPWLAHVTGGLLFGFGMTLASGCGSKMLLRTGAGNLKSFVVLLVMGLAAYMTLKGIFGVWRMQWLDPVQIDVAATGAASSTVPALLQASGIGGALPRFLPFVVAGLLLAGVLADREFRGSLDLLLCGVVVGLVIVGGWYVTSYLGYVAEDPKTLEERFVATNSGRAESFSFVAPVAYLLELLTLWSDTSRIVSFGIAGALGVLVGAAITAVVTGTFRWEGFASVEDLAHHLGGGLLMGVGGVTAMGCSIGQGISGVSTLSIGSILALAAIITGTLAGLKYQMWRVERSDGRQRPGQRGGTGGVSEPS